MIANKLWGLFLKILILKMVLIFTMVSIVFKNPFPFLISKNPFPYTLLIVYITKVIEDCSLKFEY